MTSFETELAWIRKYQHLLNIPAIEFEIDCPRGTIKNWLNGNNNLPERWEFLLAMFIIDLKKSTGTTTKLPGISSNQVIASQPMLIKENSQTSSTKKK